MEEIRTSIDKIFAQFTTPDNITSAIPKRLSYNDIDSSATKKRKLSMSFDSDQSKHNDSSMRQNDSSINDCGNITLNSTMPQSPWEYRRLKSDLIECKGVICELRKDLDNQTKLKIQTQIAYTDEVTSLKKQLDAANRKIDDMEKHLKFYRVQKRTEKDELTQLKKILQTKETSFKDALALHQRNYNQLEEKLQQTTIDMDRRFDELKEYKDKLELEYSVMQAEYESMQNRQDELMVNVQNAMQIEAQLKTETNARILAEEQVKELQMEIIKFGEWKELSAKFHERLQKISEMETEIDVLKRQNKRFEDCIGNKLLLEEEVNDLRDRLNASERNKKDGNELQSHTKILQQELGQFKKLAQDYCPNDRSTSLTVALRKFIADMLQSNIILTNDNNSLKLAKEQFDTENKELKRTNNVYLKAKNDLQTTVKHLQANAIRYKKKIILVSEERDCYKQLIDNYEKDLTVSNMTSTIDTKDQNRIRMEMLEKTVSGYKDMVATLENELKQLKSLPALEFDSVVNGMGEHYDKLRKELETLRQQNERLQSRKDSLELALEQVSVKGAFNIDKFKVLHMQMNPADMAHNEHVKEVEKLQAEIERLRRTVKKLEENHEATMSGSGGGTIANLTNDFKELNTLREKVKSLEIKLNKSRDTYRTTCNELRELCYLLFGWKLDILSKGLYRVTNRYAEAEHQYLDFALDGDRQILCQETVYLTELSQQKENHVELYLKQHHSVCALLATLTLDLFNRSTMAPEDGSIWNRNIELNK